MVDVSFSLPVKSPPIWNSNWKIIFGKLPIHSYRSAGKEVIHPLQPAEQKNM
jgi:hypothetical protein